MPAKNKDKKDLSGADRASVNTGKQKRKKTLYIEENQFRDLAEKSLVGIYLIQNEAFKYVNPKLAEIFGYTVKDLLTKIKPKDVVIPADWSLVAGNIQKRVSGEAESFHYEFRGLTRHKEVIAIEAYGSRTTYQGEPALIGTLLDITRKKRDEELLRRAEEKYRSIFENAIEGIFQTTPEGHFLVANPSFAKMLGYGSPEELISLMTNIERQAYVEPALRSLFAGTLEREGEIRGFECELYRKDGSIIIASMNARIVRDPDGTVLYYEGSIEDITEKKKVENQFRLLNEFNKAIINNAPVAIFTLDRNGMFTSINPALASLSGLGMKAEERLIGFNWLQNPYTIQCGLAAFIERGLKGEPFQLWDFPFMTYKGDRNIFMDFKGVPLKKKNGQIAGLLCIIEETTDRVMTRAKLMQEAKRSAIGRLAAGIAHELNNPLGTLVAYSELAVGCLQSIKGSSTKRPELARLKKYLTIIEEEAFRCKHVTTDILSLSHKDGLEITHVDMNGLLNNVLDLMNIEKSIRIVREITPCLPAIEGDVNALRQVFVNLISNAVDATEKRIDATIWIKTRLNNNEIVVEIEDNGMGIPDSITEKIFEPFFTTKESKKGIGLGLALCYDFVTNMGGTIKMDSKPGYGATFFVAFPVCSKETGKADR